MLVDGHAQVARITVSPWLDGTEISVNPRIGIDPEVAEWSESPFWRRMRFSERLNMIQIFLSAEIAIYEYDCTGFSRKSDVLTGEYRVQCDHRGPFGPIRRVAPAEVSWGPAADGTTSSEARYRGEDFHTGAQPIPGRRDDAGEL